MMRMRVRRIDSVRDAGPEQPSFRDSACISAGDVLEKWLQRWVSKNTNRCFL